MQADKVTAQLAPYLKHRRTGRPWVVLKLAATLDGGTAAPNGSSQWITSPAARVDGHRLRAESDAILVGAGTVRRDDPSLTVRDYQPPVAPSQRLGRPAPGRAGPASPHEAAVQPVPRDVAATWARCWTSWAPTACCSCWSRAVARSAGDFHRAGLVDRYVIYVAPALFGGDDANGLFDGAGAWDIATSGVAGSCRSNGSATTSASSWPPSARRPRPEVFTGIVEELGAVGVAGRAAAAPPGEPRCSSDVSTGGVDRGQRLLSDRGRLGRGLVGGRRQRRDLRRARRWARSRPGTRSTWSGRSGSRPPRRPPGAGPRRRGGPVSSRPRPTCGSRCPRALLRYVVEKGSITVDGCR